MAPTILPANRIDVMPLHDGDGVLDPAAVRVRWMHDDNAGGFQVYVNGDLAAATDDPFDRELLLATDAADLLAIAVLAVDTDDLTRDFAHLLDSQQRGRRALLAWPRRAAAQLGATVNIFGNGGAGPVDFATPLNAQPIPWFPDGKWGFGFGGFGSDDFAWGGARSVGLGQGAFGLGEHGFDAELATWQSDPLDAGEHRFAAIGYDRQGNASSASNEAELTLLTPPTPASAVAVTQDNDTKTLTWSTD